MNNFNILIVTEEDEFYLPIVVQKVIENCQYNIEAIFCLKNPTTSSSIKTVKRFLSTFGVLPLMKYLIRLSHAKILNLFPNLNNTGRFFSVKSIADSFNIEYLKIQNINNSEVIEWIKDKKIDLIASISPTQIFREHLINSTRFGCINIHSSFLPKHRGLYPVYWAMASGEREIGVSVHYIEKTIDTGDIIIQDKFSLTGIKTMDEALKKAKLIGAKLLLEAINCVATNSVKRISFSTESGSYHSFPDKESFKKFKKMGYSLW
ncbi:MAG TPA: formyltransferase family protein [Chitinispirillaceae bacterium]|nr:formyltransferase family protein [Chitinispirillaceae bacterium]